MWNGTHPVNAIPIVVLTHEPSENSPKGKSPIVFVTEGVESAVARAIALAGDKNAGTCGASAAQQALKVGLVDEIYRT